MYFHLKSGEPFRCQKKLEIGPESFTATYIKSIDRCIHWGGLRPRCGCWGKDRHNRSHNSNQVTQGTTDTIKQSLERARTGNEDDSHKSFWFASKKEKKKQNFPRILSNKIKISFLDILHILQQFLNILV